MATRMSQERQLRGDEFSLERSRLKFRPGQMEIFFTQVAEGEGEVGRERSFCGHRIDEGKAIGKECL